MESFSETARLIHEEIARRGVTVPPSVLRRLIADLENEEVEIGEIGAMCAVLAIVPATRRGVR